MKKPGRGNSDTVEYKPTKRKKSADSPVEYSDRWPDWEEQKQLGKRFREVGRGNWPAADILEERYSGKRKEYLVSWEPHPKTKEVWRPTWVGLYLAAPCRSRAHQRHRFQLLTSPRRCWTRGRIRTRTSIRIHPLTDKTQNSILTDQAQNSLMAGL